LIENEGLLLESEGLLLESEGLEISYSLHHNSITLCNLSA